MKMNRPGQVLSLLVNRDDRLSSEETRSPCDIWRFVDPHQRSHMAGPAQRKY